MIIYFNSSSVVLTGKLGTSVCKICPVFKSLTLVPVAILLISNVLATSNIFLYAPASGLTKHTLFLAPSLLSILVKACLTKYKFECLTKLFKHASNTSECGSNTSTESNSNELIIGQITSFK